MIKYYYVFATYYFLVFVNFLLKRINQNYPKYKIVFEFKSPIHKDFSDANHNT